MDIDFVLGVDRDWIGVSDMNAEKILEEIDKLKENCLLSEFENGYAAGAVDMANAIKDVICANMGDGKDTNVRGNDGWIPVEERLPENGTNGIYDMQLVTLKDGEVCLGVYRNEDSEWWTRKQEGETHYTNKHEGTAWQPLPEPYKED